VTADRTATLADAVARVRDGQLVALGGEQDARRPLALARELIRQGRRDLVLTGWAGGPDVSLLLEAEVARDVDIATGDRAWFGFLASSLGVPFLPLPAAAIDVPETARAVVPDIALIHADAASIDGVVLSHQDRHGFERDRALAASARTVIVSVEQIVSDLTVERRRDCVLIEGERVAAVVLAPFGSHPSAFPGRYRADADPRALATDAHADHWSYLDAQGIGRLMHTATDRRQENRP
jgi:acyl CoA:acetate/3-ketoacid CoA transferase alpha subunit